MARARKRRKHATRRRLHQEPIVREIARLLDTGTPTKWRWTSQARDGLRAAMCLEGEKWERANSRAEEIVALARHRVGISQFPSWIEARGEPPKEQEYWFCKGCGGFMKASRWPWCSEDCGMLVRNRQRRESQRDDDVARESARRVVLNGGTQDFTTWRQIQRRCQNCGELYSPDSPRRKYCSPKCSQAHAKLATRPCVVCATPFRAVRHHQIACGSTCSAQLEGRRRGWTGPYNKLCKVCGKAFIARRSAAVLCGSEACRDESLARMKRAYKARQRERQLKCEAVPALAEPDADVEAAPPLLAEAA